MLPKHHGLEVYGTECIVVWCVITIIIIIIAIALTVYMSFGETRVPL
jgi:hypothetical protein